MSESKCFDRFYVERVWNKPKNIKIIFFSNSINFCHVYDLSASCFLCLYFFIFINCIISNQIFASVYFKLYKMQNLVVKMICVLLNNDLCILNSVQWQRMSTNSRYSLVLCTFHLNLIAQKVQILLLGKYHKIKKTSPECIAETFIAFSTSYV